jgi:hypothetical protein
VATIISVTNAHRKKLKAQHNALYAPAQGSIAVPYENERAQDMILWSGLIVQASVTELTAAYNLRNALRFKVITVDATSTTLARINDLCQQGEQFMQPVELLEKTDWHTFTVPTPLVPRKFLLTHCITYDSAQPRTLHFGVRLEQLDHPRMTLRRLIVGLGRAPVGMDVELARR